VRGLAQESLSVDQWLVIMITDDEDATAPDETVCRDPVSITIRSVLDRNKVPIEQFRRYSRQKQIFTDGRRRHRHNICAAGLTQSNPSAELRSCRTDNIADK